MIFPYFPLALISFLHSHLKQVWQSGSVYLQLVITHILSWSLWTFCLPTQSTDNVLEVTNAQHLLKFIVSSFLFICLFFHLFLLVGG